MNTILFTLGVWFSDASMGWPEPNTSYAQVLSKGTVEIVRKLGGEIVERRCMGGVCREHKIGFVPIFDPPSRPRIPHDPRSGVIALGSSEVGRLARRRSR